MNYEDFIYELIKLFKNCGMWKEIKICCGDRIYKPCLQGDGGFKALTDVMITKMTEEERAIQSRMPDQYEMYVELNGPLYNMFEFGILETELEDMPYTKREEAFNESEKLQKRFKEEYDLEEIMINPEAYDIPSELEFDSADEYRNFVMEEMDRLKKEYITNLYGTIAYGTDLEAEICDVCIKHNLLYEQRGIHLYIGREYF